MERPVLKPTSITEETFGNYTYHLDGKIVPALTIQLKPNQNVFFEHHVILWKNTEVGVKIKPMKGAFKRMFAGLPIFLTQTEGEGYIAFSRNNAGHVLPIHLKPGEGVEVREHQFLAATSNIAYDFTRVKGVKNIMLGASGLFIDHFHCRNSEGIVWLHGYGNVFEKKLAPGEQIDIEPGSWIYKSPSLKMESVFQRLTTGILGASGMLTVNRFTGPGIVGIQSMSPVLMMEQQAQGQSDGFLSKFTKQQN